jgi:DNA-binding CsgD family transcriptional regulator
VTSETGLGGPVRVWARLRSEGIVAAAGAEPRLLEREAELEYLSGRLGDAREGRGGVVAIEGPAGIGKSALLSAVGRAARDRGLGVVRAHGGELEAGMAFGVARQLLEPAVVSAGPAQRRRLLAGQARLGVCALGLEAGDAPGDEFAALHGLYWLCANLAEGSALLVAVDDVQWADAPSLSWLLYLGRRAADLGVLVAVSVREGDPRACQPAVAGLVGDPAVERLRLSPLGTGSVAAVARADLGETVSPEFCLACWELTGGNPLYVRQLVAAARGAGLAGDASSVAELRVLAPSAVAASVLPRLARMGSGEIALARALAVLGAGTEVAVAAQLARLAPQAAELASDRLTAAQIFASARPLEFFHPVIGEAVYADLAPGARRLAHRRAAAIADTGGGLDRVAAHLLLTGPSGDPWVVERLNAAAQSALDRGAPDVAASYLRRALAEPPSPDRRFALMLRLGTAEWRAGHPDAIGHLQEALATAPDADTAADAAAALALAYRVLDRSDMSIAVLQQAIARLEHADAWRALTLESSSALAGVMDDRTAQAALKVVGRLSGRLGEFAEPPPYLLAVLANVAMRRQQPEEAQQLVDRALAGESYPPPLDACTAIIATLIALESHDTLQRLCHDLLAAARRRSALQETAGIASFSAWAMYRRGELADAEAQARWAAERATGIYSMHAVAQLIEPLIERDLLDEAEHELHRVADPLSSHSINVTTFLFARGRLRAAQGRVGEALHDHLECGRRSALLGRISVMYHWRSEAALAHASLGNAQEAHRLAGEEVELARGFGRPGALGIALRNRGLVEGGDLGLELLAEAVQILEVAQAPVELARALASYGAALRRAGQRAEARAQLERGLDLAHHWGARRIAGQARAELVTAGAKPRRDAITGRDALTASELRVARLAADGMTNREIAQALFITTKTAAVHLTHVYRKLGISHRAQLPAALASRIVSPGELVPDAAEAIS